MGVATKTTDNINVLLDKTEDWKEKGIPWTEVINKPHWVTSATKPTYTAAEVGALPSTTHIPTKVSELETDLWDGVTISQSLQGTGTKEEPYLIQSCADLLFVRDNPEPFSDLNSIKYIKFTKSLDFNGNALPVLINTSGVTLVDVNGNNARISNFLSSADESRSIFWKDAGIVLFYNLVIEDFVLNKNRQSNIQQGHLHKN